jgi:hypothetical protein
MRAPLVTLPTAGDGRWRRIGSFLAWQVSESVAVRTKEGRATAPPGRLGGGGAGGERWPARDDQFRCSYRPRGATDLLVSPVQASTTAATISSTAPTISS